MEKKRIPIDWNPAVQLGVVVLVLFGANIPFYLASRYETKEIQKEMTDFHKKMAAIEERNRSK